MNLELFIARKLLRGDGAKAVSVPIVKIALVGIAFGVCVMLLSIFIIIGFKNGIADKLSGFSAHLNIVNYDGSAEGGKLMANDTLLADLEGIDGLKALYVYVTKPAILRSSKEIHGVVLRGVDSLYSGDFFRQSLKEGEMPDYHTSGVSNDILISASVADLLDVKAGDKLQAHFVQDPPRVRSLTVKGIYDTGFKEYDDVVVLCDIRHLQRLNGWGDKEVSGIAIELVDIEKTDRAETEVDELLPWDGEDSFYKIVTLRDMAPQVFDWLALLNMNVWIILILVVIVAGFNMVSGLLILILDKTNLIGILKALGYKDVKLRKLFLYISIGLIGQGMLWGNVLAFVLAGLQYYFKIIHLDPASYYMDTVPISFNMLYVLLLNAGVLVVSVLMLIVPTMLISRIKPIKAIRFE